MFKAESIPNALTMARIALAPALAVALLADGATTAALVVFVAGMTTDFLDGQIARSRQLVTNFGKLMDPIADKLFIGTAFVCLALNGQVAAWVVAVVFVRELLVTALRLAARRERVIIAASNLGKAKTAIQTATVFGLIVASGAAPVHALVYVMVAITVVSGIDYVAGFVVRPRLARRPAPQPLRVPAYAPPGSSTRVG